MIWRLRRKRKKRKSVVALLRDSPINYMSDLFIVAMVLSWIIIIFIMVVMAIWTSTTKITHVGVYGGDGYVYEAKNHASGVCKTAYKQSDWNYWAQCSYITDNTATASSTATTSLAAQTTAADEKTVWDYLYGKIGNAYGVAGLMGNLCSA